MLKPEQWVDNYSDMLYRFALKRLNNNTKQAEDIVQEVFLSAWKSRASYNGTASEKTWLFTICKNRIIDFYRKDSQYKKQALDAAQDDTDIFFAADGHFNQAYKPVNSRVFDGTGSIIEKEFFKTLHQCRTKLKKLQEQVFSMKYLEDIEPEEICTLLGITTQNYWVLIHRAKLQLRTCLERNWINV